MKNCGIDFEKTAWDVLTAAISLYEKSDFMFYYRIKYLVIVSSRTGSSSELPKVDSQLIMTEEGLIISAWLTTWQNFPSKNFLSGWSS